MSPAPSPESTPLPSRLRPGWQRRLALLAGGGGVLLGLAKIGALWPVLQWVPRCPLHAVTGFHCPGCGATRALGLLAQGDFLAALHHNALVVLLLPWLVWEFLAGPRVGSGAWPRWGVVLLVLVLVAFGVLRNVPVAPWVYLAPPGSIGE